MIEQKREELLRLNEKMQSSEGLDFDLEKVVDDEPGAHKSHRRISRYGRSHHRFNQTMKGK